MVHSALTNQIRISSQSSDRQGTTVDTVLWHHQAGTNDDAVIRSMVEGTREVSANYTISNEGRLTCVVDERRRAWTSGSSQDGGKGAAWDRRSITIEIENQTGAPNWAISDAAIDTAARLLNDLRSRYGIKFRLGHRDLWTQYRASYPTFCPGPSTVDRINRRADELAGRPTPRPVPVTPPAPPSYGGHINFGGTAGRTTWRGIQKYLSREWGYNGIVDGIPGKLTWTALQKFLKRNWGYQGAIDGLPGKLSWASTQNWLKAKHGYSGPIDGIPGTYTYAALGRAGKALSKSISTVLPRTAIDGVPGQITWRRAQSWLARSWDYRGPIDGVPGRNTWKAMQRYLAKHWGYKGAIDGIPGKLTYTAMQKWLRSKWKYQGAIDGIPGVFTWSAFQRFVNEI